MKHLTIYESVDFSEEFTTERGEKVYKNCRIDFISSGGHEMKRVITCDKGVGVTEEWIEDTIVGALEALAKDYPNDRFEVTRIKPNHILIQYAGTRERVN